MFSGIRTSEDDLLDAIERMDDGDYQGALPILSRVVAFDSTNADAYELWIACHLHTGWVERALELIDERIATGVASARLYIQKAAALRRLNRLDEAAEAARLAVAAEPDSSDAVRALAAVEIARGSGDAAIQLLQNALRRSPDDDDVHFALIELASKLERSDLVITSARDYLRRFERDPAVLSMLGQAYVAVNDLRRADRAFRDAASADPEEIEHHVNVMMVALLAGKPHEFDAYAERLHTRDPELAEAAVHHVDLLIARTSDEE